MNRGRGGRPKGTRAPAIVAELEAINRERALTPEESARLERAHRAIYQWNWNRDRQRAA